MGACCVTEADNGGSASDAPATHVEMPEAREVVRPREAAENTQQQSTQSRRDDDTGSPATQQMLAVDGGGAAQNEHRPIVSPQSRLPESSSSGEMNEDLNSNATLIIRRQQMKALQEVPLPTPVLSPLIMRNPLSGAGAPHEMRFPAEDAPIEEGGQPPLSRFGQGSSNGYQSSRDIPRDHRHRGSGASTEISISSNFPFHANLH